MDRRTAVCLLLLTVACAKGDAPARDSTALVDSASGSIPLTGGAGAIVTSDTIAPPAAGGAAAAGATGSAAPNLQGRIPVLEYHVIGGDKNTLYTRTIASYQADLEEAYKRGYRPISIQQMLDKDFSEVPAGMAPSVWVFDDASDSQFRYIEKDGKLEIDPTSAVGIWLEFGKTHPGWNNRAVFCMLNGGAVGHNFFGDNPKWGGQKKEWRHQKVKWLADNGFELCSHTLWHARLDKYSDAVIQEQIARNVMGIDSAVAGYKVRTFALPYGIWPKNRPLAWQGSWTDPKTGKTHSYKFDAVLEVAGGPTRSPYDPAFNSKSINRIEAIGEDIKKALTRLDAMKTRMVVGAK